MTWKPNGIDQMIDILGNDLEDAEEGSKCRSVWT